MFDIMRTSVTMATRNTLRRALLYVPGSSQRFLDKSRTLTADCVAYDLEDSVTPHQKAEARSLVRRALDQPLPSGIRERAVRINSVESGLALADLTEVLKSPNLTTIVIPKVNSASDLTFVSDVINHILRQQKQAQTDADSSTRPPISFLALIESAKSLINLTEITTSTPNHLQGLIFAAEDFALDLSLTRTPSLTEFLFARSAIATAARAANLPSTIDLVCTEYRQTGNNSSGRDNTSSTSKSTSTSVLEEECTNGKSLGFNGKQCIHPSQVEPVQRIFSPEQAEVDWAMRVVIADEKAARAGRGAWTLDGKMIDVPVVRKAREIVNKAEGCGVDVGGLRERWKGEEPQ